MVDIFQEMGKIKVMYASICNTWVQVLNPSIFGLTCIRKQFILYCVVV